VNLVTTPEEKPVNETITMHRAQRDDLHMPTGLLFVNRLHAGGLAAEDVQKLERAARSARDPKAAPLLTAVAARARAEIGWAELIARHRARLVSEVDLPVIDLPFLFAEELGFAELRALAQRLTVPALSTRRSGRA
jgi:hypothetical protein